MFEKEYLEWNLTRLEQSAKAICKFLESYGADTANIHHKYERLLVMIRDQAEKLPTEDLVE